MTEPPGFPSRRSFLKASAATVALFVLIPKGFFPQQDTGFISGFAESAQDSSSSAMSRRLLQLADIIGRERCALICADDYHRYSRQERLDAGLSPADPRNNHLDILEQHLWTLRTGKPMAEACCRSKAWTRRSLRKTRMKAVEALAMAAASTRSEAAMPSMSPKRMWSRWISGWIFT